MKYEEADFIQKARDGETFGKYYDYKYRVLGRDGFPTHHTNSLTDARSWFNRCVEFWEQQDSALILLTEHDKGEENGTNQVDN